MRRLQFKIRLNARRRFRYLSIRHWFFILDTGLYNDLSNCLFTYTADKCLQTLTHIQLKNRLWTTVAFLRYCNLIWGLANNNYSIYFLQFLTIRQCQWQITFTSAIFSFPNEYCTVLLNIVVPQRHRSAEDHTNMSYYNMCGIGSQHSNTNISKWKGGGGTYKYHWYARLLILLFYLFSVLVLLCYLFSTLILLFYLFSALILLFYLFSPGTTFISVLSPSTTFLSFQPWYYFSICFQPWYYFSICFEP